MNVEAFLSDTVQQLFEPITIRLTVLHTSTYTQHKGVKITTLAVIAKKTCIVLYIPTAEVP